MTYPHSTTPANIYRANQIGKGYDNPGRVSFQLSLYFLCHAQTLTDLSTCSTERDRLRPSAPCATVLIIRQLFTKYSIRFDLNLACYTPLSTSQGATTR